MIGNRRIPVETHCLEWGEVNRGVLRSLLLGLELLSALIVWRRKWRVN